MIDARPGHDLRLREMLVKHPRVQLLAGESNHALEFGPPGRARSIDVGEPSSGLAGIIELLDNNPLVCADNLTLPGPAATLALIALGPLVRAGILVEDPTLLFSFGTRAVDVLPWLITLPWAGGVVVGAEPMALGTVLALTAIAAVQTPDDLHDLDALYEDSYGRSFYVRENSESAWDVALVAGKPFAAYRLSISPDQPHSLLTIRVMADQNGKCGAAQVVHAMNVMSGFEESLGIDG